MADGTKINECCIWQRRMGVEPTRDRAERPPSRFEDGETHRGPYTSMLVSTGRIVPLATAVVKQALQWRLASATLLAQAALEFPGMVQRVPC
jgi:hypothetical protein